jgi:DNA mismatch repair ATPase MutS
MAVLGLAALLSPLALGSAGWLLPFAVFALNYVLHARIRVRYGPEILGLRYLAAALATAGAIARQRPAGLEQEVAVLAAHHRAARPVARAIALFPAGSATDLLYEYVNILFLLEARGLARALRAVRDPALRGAVVAVGELDAAQAVASFRAGLPYSCAPELEDGRARLEVADVFHPLLAAPVPNTIVLEERGTLVTGSNMSGKSTFLRALGINAILAQTTNTALSRRYRAGRLRVLSSMRSQDDVVEGRSAYWAEAERLLAIIRAVDGAPPVLCLIDEILSGTNSEERRAASAEILQFLARGALVVATTHDLELTATLAGSLDCYHFAGEPTPEGMRFSHELRPGVTRDRNAIELLGLLGYPRDIVAGARRRVEAEAGLR